MLPRGWIATFVERAGVIARIAHIVHQVVFEDVVVAADADGHVRRVVQQIVRGTVADAAECNAAGIGELVLREPPDVVVHGLVARRRERLAVAAFQHETARAGIVDVAAFDAMAGAPRHPDAHLAHVADLAGLHAIAAPAGHGESVAEARFHDETAQRHVGGLLQRHERRVERGEHDARAGHLRGRPEIEPTRTAIRVVFAGLVQLLQQVQRAIAARRRIALLDAIDRRTGQRDLALLAIERLYPNGLFVPIVTPVSQQPDTGLDVPTGGTVATVFEGTGPWRLVGGRRRGAAINDLGNCRPAFVGPTGKRHALVVEEQFRHRGRAPEKVGKAAQFLGTDVAQIGLQDLAASHRIEASQYLLVDDGNEGVG